MSSFNNSEIRSRQRLVGTPLPVSQRSAEALVVTPAETLMIGGKRAADRELTRHIRRLASVEGLGAALVVRSALIGV